MGDNLKQAQDFIAAWNANDVERIMGFIAEDCFYHNIPMEPMQGAEAIRGFIQGFAAMASQIDWVVHHIAEGADGSVLSERTDRFLIGDDWLEIRVMGTMEFASGKLTAWRDYFDLAEMQRQMPGGGA